MSVAGTPSESDGSTHNNISGGVFFHAIIQGRDITVQLPPQVPPALSGMPAALPVFAGRRREIQALLEALQPDQSRLGTALVSAVVGLAGVGKTELALQTARQALALEGWFPGGVLFVDLFGYDDERQLSPGRALGMLLHALGMPQKHIPVDAQTRSRLYRSVLAAYAAQGRRILLVIDNASSTTQIEPLLPSDGVTPALITSRHTLAGIGARLHDLDVLTPDAAVDLLRQALQHGRGAGDNRVDDSPEAAHAIAELCGHLPLALQIAAALLTDDRQRPLETLVDDLADSGQRLGGLERDEQAVRIPFDLSYLRLKPDQSRLFRLLSLNMWSDTSTEAAMHLFGADHRSTRRLLESLGRAHLIEPGSVYGRWRMHDLVRLYAFKHAQEHEDEDGVSAALDRLWSYYGATVVAADSRLTVSSSRDRTDGGFRTREEAVDWLTRERPNLLGAIWLSEAVGQVRHTAVLTVGIMRFLFRDQHVDESLIVAQIAMRAMVKTGSPEHIVWAREILGRALANAKRYPEAVAEYEQVIAVYRAQGDRTAEARALDQLGLSLGRIPDMQEASLSVHQDAFAIYGELEDRAGQAETLNNMGLALQRLDRFADAIDCHEQAAAVFADLGDEGSRQEAVVAVADAWQGLRDFDAATDSYTQSIAHYRERGDRAEEAGVWQHLGVALMKLERFPEAGDAHMSSATLWHELKQRDREAVNLVAAGSARYHAGQFDLALSAYGDALSIHEERDDDAATAEVLVKVAEVLEADERIDEAVRALRQANELYRGVGNTRNEGRTLNALGRILSLQSRFEEAITINYLAAKVWSDLGERYGEAITLDLLGMDLEKVDRREEAIIIRQRAIAAWRDVGDRQSEATSLVRAADNLLRLVRPEESVTLYRDAIELFRALDDSRGEAGASNMLAFALQAIGHVDEAIDMLERAAAAYEAVGDGPRLAKVQENLFAIREGQSGGRRSQRRRMWRRMSYRANKNVVHFFSSWAGLRRTR